MQTEIRIKDQHGEIIANIQRGESIEEIVEYFYHMMIAKGHHGVKNHIKLDDEEEVPKKITLKPFQECISLLRELYKLQYHVKVDQEERENWAYITQEVSKFLQEEDDFYFIKDLEK